MSKRNKVNPGQYTQGGRLAPDDAAREREKQELAAVASPDSNRRRGTTGISNRESGDEEHDERERLPATTPDRTAGEAASENDAPAGGENEQTSTKSGSRSGAQKAAEAKYVERPHPASEKVEGAFGREPKE